MFKNREIGLGRTIKRQISSAISKSFTDRPLVTYRPAVHQIAPCTHAHIKKAGQNKAENTSFEYISEESKKLSAFRFYLWHVGLVVLFSTFFSANLAAAAEVTLAWDANTEPDLAGYKIYYDTSSGPPYCGTEADQGTSSIIVLVEDLDDPDFPEYTITGLGEKDDYYFAVTAFDNENSESGYSNEATTADAAGEDEGGDGGGGGCFISSSGYGLHSPKKMSAQFPITGARFIALVRGFLR
jgi:hypothetical protein